MSYEISGIYGFVLFPPGWKSFQQHPTDSADKYEYIRGVVGNYSYFALGLYLTMQFVTKIGVAGLPHMFTSEVFPLRFNLRSTELAFLRLFMKKNAFF